VVYIHPLDAKTRGIKHKDRVRVFNGRGAFELEASFDLGIKQGCVAITNGWWITQGGTVNYLSKGRETDMGYGTAFHDNMVEVEKCI
jgi:anaerobic selenocysteine-containing dehydrogenase